MTQESTPQDAPAHDAPPFPHRLAVAQTPLEAAERQYAEPERPAPRGPRKGGASTGPRRAPGGGPAGGRPARARGAAGGGGARGRGPPPPRPRRRARTSAAA